MMYKNAFKLVISNFHLVWKTLLYQIFVVLITIGLAFACSLPIINVISNAGIFKTIAGSFNEFATNFNIYKLFSDLILSVESLFKVIAENINSLWLYIVLFLVIIVLVRTILRGFSNFASTGVLYNYLSSNIKVSYVANLTNNFFKNIKFQLAYLIVELPINLLIVFCAYMLFKWMLSLSGLILLAPIVLIILLVLVISLKQTIFSAWLPALITFNCSIFGALKKGIKAVFRRFYRSYSTAILILATLVILNVFCALCTFGASLLLTLPISSLTINIFGMVVFYSSQGMRFYVDSENVITTKKMEETDAFSKLKFIV